MNPAAETHGTPNPRPPAPTSTVGDLPVDLTGR
jgi:hypothetical protein